MSVALPLDAGVGRVTRMPLSAALALGSDAWEPLEAAAAAPSPFMSWAWHRAWHDTAPPADVAASEAVVLRGPDGGLQAVMPLRRQRVQVHRVPVNALTWAAGDTGCPDHVDLLARRGAPVADLAELLATLSWDVLDFPNLAPEASTAEALAGAMRARGFAVRRTPLWVCPHLDLPGDWDRYLAALTPTRRQTLRRKERHLQQHRMSITDYAGARVAEGLDHLVTLHAQRWESSGESGAFQDTAVRALHRRFAAELAARDRLWLSTLDVAGSPVAAWYGFAWGDTVYFYQSGRDPQWERESVGLVLMGAMIRRAIEQGFRRFDFLRGADPYKRQWTAASRVTEQLTIIRPGLGGRVLRILGALSDLRARLRGPARWG